MAMATTYAPLPQAEHSAQLRKAVIASTIGTTIEWYDFFIYGTAAGLVFGKLYLPQSGSAVPARLLAFGTYFVGFVARPIGAAIFGHYGDRIGRKATLIATLLVMGIATFLVAFVPTYASIGIWGAVILTVLRALQGIGVGGEWGGSVLLAMEWSRTHGQRGLVASWPQFGVPCGLLLSNLAILAVQRLVGRPIPGLGLARSVPALHRAGRHRPVDPSRHPRDAGVPEAARREQDRAGADPRSDQKAAARDHPLRAAAHGRAGAVLHLHRLRLRLCGRHPEDVAGFHPHRGAGGGAASRSSPFRSPAISPTGSAGGRCI